jgi:nitroimidazol reductase NimA-like FMN-containing flavoprotein (pyridoxamine 5'-phosphate oxidase superfamily)
MNDRASTLARLKSLFLSQRFAALATQGEGRPYASLVAFAATDDLRLLVFATLRTTRKYANLAADSRVALLVDDRSNRDTDLEEAMAVTATGIALEASEAERAGLLRLLLAKHQALAGFVGSPGCALVAVRVDAYQVVTHFGDVYELSP